MKQSIKAIRFLESLSNPEGPDRFTAWRIHSALARHLNNYSRSTLKTSFPRAVIRVSWPVDKSSNVK